MGRQELCVGQRLTDDTPTGAQHTHAHGHGRVGKKLQHREIEDTRGVEGKSTEGMKVAGARRQVLGIRR